MDYTVPLKHHYKPARGWMNDPNGLVYFDGWYHAFYQHAPNHEVPWKEPMHWGHARTKDFLHWEELPVALYPDMPYDRGGCWSGTATVKDGVLYLIYSSILPDGKNTQTVSIASSTDGIHFQKYAGNPVIRSHPADGGPDFRDPALALIDGSCCLVMATGHPESRSARLLLYKSGDLFNWDYQGILCQWDDKMYAECPSFMKADDRYLLTASVCAFDHAHYFAIMYGDFANSQFTPKVTGQVDHGPDQYAGQVFRDHLGRNILMAWIPGWPYNGYAARDVGCLSLPRELKCVDGRVLGYPIREVQHLLVPEDPAVQRTGDGFIIERTNRSPVIHKGPVRELAILRDSYILEVFVNGGEDIYSVLL